MTDIDLEPANVKIAIEAVLREEDSTLSGVIVNTPGDTGKMTRFGLASRWHPELRSTTFYGTMSTADALQVAVNILNLQYAEPMKIGQIADQAIATKLLSLGVNAGTHVAVSILQRAVNIPVDGEMGPLTIGALNNPLTDLMPHFRLAMIRFYVDLCNRRQADRNELMGWLNRALA
jgi:lysozyme family protein